MLQSWDEQRENMRPRRRSAGAVILIAVLLGVAFALWLAGAR